MVIIAGEAAPWVSRRIRQWIVVLITLRAARRCRADSLVRNQHVRRGIRVHQVLYYLAHRVVDQKARTVMSS